MEVKKDGKKIKKAIKRQEGHARSVSAASIKSVNKSCHQILEKQMNTLCQQTIDSTIITLIKQRFVVMHTFRKTEIPALLDSWVTNTPSVKILCPQKITSPYVF